MPKSIELSSILSAEQPKKECKKCKIEKPFNEFYTSNDKSKRRQLSHLLINASKYNQEYIDYQTKCIETDNYCKECRKTQVKISQASSKDRNLAEIIDNFWNFHYNKYPKIANYFPGFGDFDNNPIKNTIWNADQKPFMLRPYTYMFFFQFHNDRYRKIYIDNFLIRYIEPDKRDLVEVSPTIQQEFHYNFRQQIQLFTMFKYCPQCKEFRQTYEEYENIRQLVSVPGKQQLNTYLTPKFFKRSTNKTKNGWQKHCMICNKTVRDPNPFSLKEPNPVDSFAKKFTEPQQLDPRRDRNSLYAQMPEELFTDNPTNQGEEK